MSPIAQSLETPSFCHRRSFSRSTSADALTHELPKTLRATEAIYALPVLWRTGCNIEVGHPQAHVCVPTQTFSNFRRAEFLRSPVNLFHYVALTLIVPNKEHLNLERFCKIVQGARYRL